MNKSFIMRGALMQGPGQHHACKLLEYYTTQSSNVMHR